MALPGFTADASFKIFHCYATSTSNQLGRGGLALAGTCTDPNDCDTVCGHLQGCARYRCKCDCEGGTINPNPHMPCGFLCMLM
jgi:hypothetical protein